MDRDVKFPDGLTVSGKHPLVIIGPNGVGKTRLGVTITKDSKAERVAALRNVEISEIPMQRLAQASQFVKRTLLELLSQHWKQSLELQNLLSEILAEDRDCAVLYREASERTPGNKPDEKLTKTRLRKIIDIWNRHFPGRQIKIDYEPKVERTVDGKTAIYSIAQMSEGERTALYIISRVVSCDKAVLVVDEPETFFHPLLARNLWNDLEETAPNIRFVYITHDIPFALSRREAQFAIARSETKAELLISTSKLPPDTIAQVLGAASFSVSASRLIFCEGQSDSYDNQILAAWHDCSKTAVVVVGGCNAVRECVSVFREGNVTAGVDAYGYIDRDGWPDDRLKSEQFVRAHPVSEIEGFLCLEPIFMAIARYTGISEADAAERYEGFLTAAKNNFKGALLNKEILNRAKKRVETEQVTVLNPLKPDADINKVRANFEAAIPPGDWSNYLSNVFTEEQARLAASLHGKPDDFIRDFPAKSYYSQAAAQLGVTPESLLRTICMALRLSDEKAASETQLKLLRDVLLDTMGPFMWPRRI